MRNMNNISELVKYAFVTLLGTLCLAGCGQDEKIGLNATDSVAPGLPTNIEVENINGGAIIRYTPPKDDDLLCVVASYMINGVERTTKASPYVDSLIVEGFGKVGDYNIFLKSVDKSQNESEPKTVSISPLTPPVEYIYESLKITDSFGGVSLTWKNPTRQNIILEVTKKENGAVLMDDEIRKKFLTEWQKKKKETITHPYLNEKIEWGMIPYVQSMLLARYLRGDLDSYPVFLWK